MRRPTSPLRWAACAGGLLILLGGCVRPRPETAPGGDASRPPADACQELESLLAAGARGAGADSREEAAELFRRLLRALEEEPALRHCLAGRMAARPGDPGR